MAAVKKRTLFFALLTIALLIIFGCVKLYQERTSDLRIYQSRWNLSPPPKLEERFSASDPGFTGDGTRYTVFTAKEIPDGYFIEYSNKKDPDVETFADEVADGLKVEAKDRPDFTRKYCWQRYEKDNGLSIKDTLVILYSDDQFYFIERLI